VIWKRYCGTAAKAGGNRENKLLPAVTEGSCLLEKSETNSKMQCLNDRKQIIGFIRSKAGIARWMRFLSFDIISNFGFRASNLHNYGGKSKLGPLGRILYW
jgi:hypothetical protein